MGEYERMKKGAVGVLMLIVATLAIPAAGQDKPTPPQFTELQVKAAFMYNFIKFSDWPESKVAEPNTIIIGLLGEHEFGSAFDTVKDKPINNNKLIVRSFGKFSRFIKNGEDGKSKVTGEIEQLRKCHLLFICDSEKGYYKEIIDAIKDSNVLTVGETEDFLESGGMITFIPGTGKPVFEINNAAARQAEIRISSRVLRLARKVISEKPGSVNRLIEPKWLASGRKLDYSKLL
jgi:hypothetical protein